MPKETFFNLPEEKRRRIIDLAVDEFAAHAYHRASLSSIVAKAGIAKGSMYQYFQDKLDLYLYVLKLAGDLKLKTIDEALAGLDPRAHLVDRLLAATRVSLSFANRHPKLFAVGQNLLRETDVGLVTRVMAQFGPAGDNLYFDWLAAAARAGDVRPEVNPATVVFLLKLVTWQVGQDIVAGRRPMDKVEPFLAEVFDILKYGLAPRDKVARPSKEVSSE